MDDPNIRFAIDLALRVGHILPAIILIGGVFFMRLAYVPALETLGDEERANAAEASAAAWSRVVMICAAFVLLTGITNAALNIMRYTFSIGPTYHALALVKFLLALGMLFIASMLSGRSEAAQSYRQNMVFWLNVNIGLALAMVLIAGVMKVSDHIPKLPQPETPPAVTAAPR